MHYFYVIFYFYFLCMHQVTTCLCQCFPCMWSYCCSTSDIKMHGVSPVVFLQDRDQAPIYRLLPSLFQIQWKQNQQARLSSFSGMLLQAQRSHRDSIASFCERVDKKRIALRFCFHLVFTEFPTISISLIFSVDRHHQGAEWWGVEELREGSE